MKTRRDLAKLKDRQKYIKAELLKNYLFESEFIIPNIISTLKISVECKAKKINMYVVIKDEKSLNSSQQLRYVRDQLRKCWKKNKIEFETLLDSLYLYVAIKNTQKVNVISLSNFIKHDEFNSDDFNNIISSYKDIKIKYIGIALQKQLGKYFYSNTKFIQLYESTVINFYKIIISYLENQKAPTPKIESTEEEIPQTNAQ
ncbi:MAG: hypothetical protein ACRQFF_04335 [Sphaerochaeta sp.]